MNISAINEINSKLKVTPDNFADDILKYIEFLNFKNASNTFVLLEEQINLLDKRSKTPIESCIPADHLLVNLKNKYSV